MKALVRARLAVLIIVVLLSAAAAYAQQLSLAGTVSDISGAVPGATVTLSTGGNPVGEATTDGTGVYRFNGLAAGNYEVSVAMRGFETAVRNVSLSTDTPAIDVVLSVGRVSTTVNVTASAGRATATRLPVADDDVPAQVSSIPQELLRQQGINSLYEALKNASGVQAVRWYGVYEQYTIRGFFDPDRDDYNTMLLDGMRIGNRYSTQTGNVESVEVLKGPSSILYGRGSVGGSINVLRKKPQANRAYEFAYRGGRFNTNQVSGGATGPLDEGSRFLYRVDGSFEHSSGWRKAGSDRLNLSPSLTWLADAKARITVHEIFNRDRFDGDGGVPLNITTLPNYRPDLRFSLPQDNVLVKDSQTQVLFNSDFAETWTFRNATHFGWTSDKYFVTEGVYGDPSANLVYREPLDFHHHRRPIQNQAEMIGRFEGLGRHNVLFGWEYHRDKYRTDVTAGDDPDCLCGYWWLTIAPMDITTLAETQTPLDIETIERRTFVLNRTHSIYVQDQIDVLPQLKVNVGGRFDDYFRTVDRTGGFPFTAQRRNQDAFSYRAGAVYSPRYDQQIYFGTSSSFTPVRTVPANGAELEPSTARNYEVGHRWQGWHGRIDTSIAAYYSTRNNVNVQQTPTTVVQVGEQRSKGLDLDVNTDVGRQIHVILNYGFSQPVFEDAGALSGKTPRYVPKHLANAWLRKDWSSGFHAAIGARYVGKQFVNDSNGARLGGFTVFSGAVGYRRPRWEWSLNAENLFDRDRYFLPGHFSNLAFPGPPINVTSTIRMKFD
jgi:iron complex outermembrane receptor protein